MFSIDLAIALFVIFFIFSTAASAVLERLATRLNWRGKMLRQTLDRILGSTDTQSEAVNFPKRVWEQSQMTDLMVDGKKPSYLTADQLRGALVSALKQAAGTEVFSPGLLPRLAAAKIVSSPLAIQLEEIFSGPDADQKFQKWYDGIMDRLTGGYRRQCQRWLLFISFAVAFGCNVNTLLLIEYMGARPAVAAAVADMAKDLKDPRVEEDPTKNLNDPQVAQNAAKELKDKAGKLADKLETLGVPIGYGRAYLAMRPNGITGGITKKNPDEKIAEPATGWRVAVGWAYERATTGYDSFFEWLLGCSISALAISLGAPFWFDMINKVSSIRGAGKRVDTQSEQDDKATPPGSAPTSGGAALALVPGAAVVALPARTPVEILSSPETEFVLDRCLLMARLSNYAYDTATVTRKVILPTEWNWSELYLDSKVLVPDGKNDTQAYIFSNADFAVIAFRGTEGKISDICTDVNFKGSAVPYLEGLGMIHGGFATSLGDLMEKLTEQVEGLSKTAAAKGRPFTLWLTGHSLGGALATLFAAVLIKRGIPFSGLYTFGGPRVGDHVFAAYFDAAAKDRCFRVVNDEDVVTRVPTREMGFADLGLCIYLDREGQLRRDVGYWQRFLISVQHVFENYKDFGTSSVKCHSLERYIEILEKLVKKGS